MSADVSSTPKRVFVVDDSRVIRQRLLATLAATPGVSVVGSAETPATAVRLITELRPDAVVLDLRLRDGSGLTVLEQVKRLEPAPMVVVLTNYPHDEYRRQCLAAGADAFLDKSSEFEKVASAINGTYGQPALRASQAEAPPELDLLLAVVTDYFPGLVSRIGRDLRYRYASAGYQRIMGIPPDRMIGRAMPDVIGEDAFRRAEPYVKRALAGERVTFESEVRLDSERLSHGQVTLIPETGPDGQVQGFILIGQDISERTQTETALRQKTDELERYFTDALDLLCIVDTNGYFHRVNPQWEATLGYTLADLKGHRFFDFIHPDDQAATLEAVSRLASQETILSLVNRYRCSDGSYRWIEWRSRPSGKLIYAAARDITDQKQAEMALQEAQDRLRQAVVASNVGFWDWDPRTNRVCYSTEWKSQIGYEEHEISDRFHEWESRVHPDDLPGALQKVRDALEGRAAGYEAEFRVRHRDGSYRHILAQGSVLRDAAGQPIRMRGSHVDITERVELERQLHQAQKIESVGQLAAGIAHDFNNLLTAISGYSALALAELPPDSQTREDLAEVLRAADRAAALTKRLLLFTRQDTYEPKVVCLNEVISGMERMLRRVIQENVRITYSLDPTVGRVMADPSHIEQAVLNLAVNARDAMPQGGRLTIETTTLVVDTPLAGAGRVSPGQYAQLAVSDTGVGMTPEVQARMFEPFFTTKPAGQGTGLGLATVYGVVKQAKGHVLAYSEVGRGTTFRLLLPLVNQALAAPAPAPSPVASGTETILLVEDDDGLRAVATRALKRAGYTVLTSTTSDGALAMTAPLETSLDLLITDVVMPGMSGVELAALLRQRQPGVRVLFMSGYPAAALAQLGLDVQGEIYLQKPFSPNALLRAVRGTLDRVPQQAA
ncbi:MAG TPA: PAS domain S-box protein [Gemmatimonadales bacterium]|nr:PAS domain S-box protein [Gemmatimonadales bacterium]